MKEAALEIVRLNSSKVVLDRIDHAAEPYSKYRGFD